MYDLKTVYNELSLEKKKLLRNDILKKCHVSYPTFYSWLQRGIIPELEKGIVNECIETIIKITN